MSRDCRTLVGGSVLEALTAALALRRTPADDIARRRLAAAARGGDPTSRLLALHALAPGEDRRAGHLLLDALGSGDAGRREHAAWALGERPRNGRAVAGLRALAAGGGFAAMLAGLTLERWLSRPWPRPHVRRPARRVGGGLRVAQVSLQGRLDAGLRGAGAGDGGGLATLLVSLTGALDAHPGISEVVTFTRAFEDPSLPGVYTATEERIGATSRIRRLRFGPDGYLPTSAQWPFRPEIETALAQAIARRGPFDVAHLRFADVGTLAAARVFRRLGVPVVFTLAPDPHAVLREDEAAGRLDRETFPAADLEQHYAFRAWLVEWLLREADALAVLPRPGIERELRSLLGPSFDSVRGDRLWTIPEGIAIDAASSRPVSRGGAAVHALGRAVRELPEARRGLPVILTVARLHRVKGIPQLVEAWAGDPELHAGFNLVVVGGDLERPTPEEQSVLDELEAVRARLPHARAGLILLGHRPHDEVPQILRAAAHGIPGAVGAGGVYACPSRKEEFGLALLEALGAGLSVVGPDRGGPPTYIEDGRTGVLADTTRLPSLRAGLARAASARLDAARAARARAVVQERFTVDAMADRLVSMYAHVTRAAAVDAA
ncbi:MAG TPA: glycosyltransferase [Gaiellaceae bacterium]|nr:glycosyltransferase [Gaiellaceae bacterium]